MGTRLAVMISAIGIACPAVAEINFMTPVNASVAVSSGQAVAANSTRLQTDSKLYQALFSYSLDAASMEDWSGDLKEITIPTNGIVTSAATPSATAGNFFSSPEISGATISADTSLSDSIGPRRIFSCCDVDGNGQWFDVSLISAVSGAIDSLVSGATVSSLAAYITGNQMAEDNAKLSSNPDVYKGFRVRSSVFGDIINSAPEYSGDIDFGYYVTSGGSPSMGQAYLDYLQTSRQNMVYVGANDGMLHAFQADGGEPGQLEELFAYIPATLLPKLASLASPSYRHQYYVDGSPRVADAYDGGAWKTVLVGTTGAGGRGVFALDVTSPASFNETHILWDIDNQTPGFEDLGFTLAQPSIVLLEDNSPDVDNTAGNWAAVVASGHDDPAKEGVLYLIDLFDGSHIATLATGSNGGLSTPVAIDSSSSNDPDMAADIIYAGDLDGKLWKFYFNGSSWQHLELFDAGQPITAKPQVIDHPDGGFMVLFGTGKYFAEGDQNAATGIPAPNAFYGIWDKNDGSAVPALTQVEIEIDNGGLLDNGDVVADATMPVASPRTLVATFRVTSVSTFTHGWYMELTGATFDGNFFQERVVSEPLVRNGRVVFTTLIPDGKAYSGTGWLMEVDALTGSRLDEVALDINKDGKFDDMDKVSIKNGAIVAEGTAGSKLVAVSGLQSTVGLISTPNVISTSNKELKYLSGSSGKIETVQESTNNASFDKGRQSWQQLK